MAQKNPSGESSPSDAAVGAQDRERRDHRDEDADEQPRDLGDGRPLEVVARAVVRRGRDPGQGRRPGSMSEIWATYSRPTCAPKTSDAEGPSRLGVDERLELRDEPVEDDARDDDAAGGTGCASPAGGWARGRRRGTGARASRGSRAAPCARSERSTATNSPMKQDDVDEQQRPDVLKRPEERHAAQVAEEQRRVAQRREAAAGVGDQEDEEHDDVGAVPAPQVRAQQRADEQHGRAGGAHPARQHRCR